MVRVRLRRDTLCQCKRMSCRQRKEEKQKMSANVEIMEKISFLQMLRRA